MTAARVDTPDRSDGVRFTRLEPGGPAGPNGETLLETPCGQSWAMFWRIGEDSDPFKMAIPDIRMPRNQFWPLHWHDEWIAVLVLEGTVLIGDWWMERGDVLVSKENFEYGPVVAGPAGCQLLEVFARDNWGSGYAPEFHDHPTLQASIKNGTIFGPTDEPLPSRSGLKITARPLGSEHHGGNQTLPVHGVPELSTGTLTGGQRWDLGEPDDPERGVLIDTKLRATQQVPPHRHDDARWLLVIHGSMHVGTRELVRDDIMITRRAAPIEAFLPGPEGVHFVEFARSAAGLATICDATHRTNPAYAHLNQSLPEVVYR